ncbi:MAG: NAD(P)H-dependent oxidoreductase subunit E [Acidobacteriota bacterium]|nr:NAD(P)H-dependent oxidoreductase subunit E [Acidobacteriota bacterium]
MDLHIAGAEATEAEREAVDRLLGPPASGWQGAARDIGRDGRTAIGGRQVTGDRDLLLPAFHAVQDAIGWISHGALNYICTRLSVPPAEAWGVVTFYHLLATESRPTAVAHVCDDIACRLSGAEQLCRDLESRLGHAVHRSPCLGQCDHGSAALITRAGSDAERFVLAPASADEVARPLSVPKVPFVPGVPRVGAGASAKILRRMIVADVTRLDTYRQHGGYAALTKAIAMGPAAVIAEVSAAKLLGRGGAAFPTGRKWDAVAHEPATPHYVVCNADESEPGTFKDRVLMEQDPLAVIEAMTICGLATGSERGFIYIRGEYPEAESAIGAAIEQARAAGLLGPSVAGSGHAFEIEIRRGGGAYICGEETSLFNSIEGKRGEPRSKPPFPAQIGVFGKPTVVNNVETLVNVLDILVEGSTAWARTGTAGSTGTRLFCLSGHVAKPGLYEIECGQTLRHAIDLAGGIPGGRALQAVLLGGAAGTFVGPDALDMPLSFEGARAANATLGSGVIMVFDDTADLLDTLARIAQFFRDESCGQCVPCRVGTVRQEELLRGRASAGVGLAHRSVGGGGSRESQELLGELGQAMRDASICGLGQTAASAIESAFANIPSLKGTGS